MSLIELIFGYMPARIIHVAARLAIADLLADGPQTSEELAARTSTHAPSLHRLLRALASLGIVTETEPGRFELSPTGAQLRTGVPNSVRGLAMLCSSDQVWRSWGQLLHSVQTGETGWELVTGVKPFDWMKSHAEDSAVFNAAMADQTRRVIPGIVEGYDFSPFHTLVDVGGGDGTFLAGILNAVPGLSGVVFDMPSGVESAAETIESAGVADRCRVALGDFFQTVPSGSDAYILKSVIHDWDDDQATMILESCRAAMSRDAKLLVVELVLPSLVTPKSRGAVLSDISMLVNPGGRERTEDEFRALLTMAGFEVTAVVGGLGGDYHVIEAMVASSPAVPAGR